MSSLNPDAPKYGTPIPRRADEIINPFHLSETMGRKPVSVENSPSMKSPSVIPPHKINRIEFDGRFCSPIEFKGSEDCVMGSHPFASIQNINNFSHPQITIESPSIDVTELMICVFEKASSSITHSNFRCGIPFPGWRGLSENLYDRNDRNYLLANHLFDHSDSVLGMQWGWRRFNPPSGGFSAWACHYEICFIYELRLLNIYFSARHAEVYTNHGGSETRDRKDRANELDIPYDQFGKLTLDLAKRYCQSVRLMVFDALVEKYGVSKADIRDLG